MTYLKYYQTERAKYSKAYSIYFSEEKFRKIIKMIKRKFDIYNLTDISFDSYNNGHCIYTKNYLPYCSIDLPKKTSLGLVCHEIAHAWELKEYKKAGHTKRHARLMKRIMTYAKKRHYWKKEEQEIVVDNYNNIYKGELI